MLPDPSSPMLDELCVEESGGKVQSVDKKGKVVVNERIGLIPRKSCRYCHFFLRRCLEGADLGCCSCSGA